MKRAASTPAEYLAALPPDRRAAIQAVREVILANLDAGYREGMQYGMIGYFVPHEVYPAGYHCDPRQPLPFAGLGSRKDHMALHMMCLYGSADLNRWFVDEWKRTGKRLDMGNACIRFRKLDDLALDVIGRLVARVPAKRYIEACEAAQRSATATRARRSSKRR